MRTTLHLAVSVTLATGLGGEAIYAQQNAPADDTIRTLVSRLDLEYYKTTL